MTYYANISSPGKKHQRQTLTAKSLQGAKREAAYLYGDENQFALIFVGVLVNEGTPDEYGDPMAFREVTPRSRWRPVNKI